MKITSRLLASVAIAATLAFGVAACAPAAEPVSISAETVVIDVRTPEEFASGHLEGAVNIDVQSASFDAAVSELPTDGEYVVYCRSGNRSAAAIDRMEDLGFTAMTNAGAVGAASESTGLAITK